MKKFSKISGSLNSVIKNLFRLLSLAWKTDKGLTIGYYGMAGLGAFFPILSSYVYKLVVDYLVESQGLQTTIPLILIAILGSRYVISIAQDTVMWALKNTYFDYLFRNKLQNALNYNFHKKVSKIDIAHLEDPKTEDLIAKAEDTLTWRPPDFLKQFSYVFNNFVSFVSAFIFLAPYGWWIPFVITFLALPRLFLRARYGKIQWSIYGSGAPEARKLWYFGLLLSNKSAITESRILQSHDTLLKKFKNTQEFLYNRNKKPIQDFMKVAIIPDVVEMCAVFLIALSKLPLALSGAITVGGFTFFMSLLDRISYGAADMILNLGDMYENNLYVDHYFEVLNLSRIVKESKNPKSLGSKVKPIKIEFRNVSFKYPGSKKKVLNNLSFTVEPGENVAIIGPNGAGKTTIVKLLCRFYDVSEGEILLNGINIKEVKLSEWYEFLGTLFQEFMHYDFTVRENIYLGRQGLQDEKLMIEAAKKSGASDFIEKLPQKYDQLLGRQFEGGIELSQGQWQKLAIARTFYEGSPILILDEPTSAIDADAEYEIFNNLNKFYKNKTLILISHRFSTVRNADKIIVLEKGKITEKGSHNDLISLNGTYARMFKKQALGYQ